MSGFRDMIADALAFFGELEANNNRDWFTGNKDRYTEAVKRPAELFITLMEEKSQPDDRRTADRETVSYSSRCQVLEGQDAL